MHNRVQLIQSAAAKGQFGQPSPVESAIRRDDFRPEYAHDLGEYRLPRLH